MKNLYSVILAGGSGTRLWPLSRSAYPKQFIKLFGDESLFQKTVLRNSKLSDHEPIILVGKEHRFIVAEQLREVEIKATIVTEPIAKNTSPAATVAALIITKKSPEALMLISPSDHIINDEEEYRNNIVTAVQAAKKDFLVTFGINPTTPQTGYGYIKNGSQIDDNIPNCFHVSTFTEKPDKEKAAHYVKSKNYYWNSGIFLFPVKKYLDLKQSLHPQTFSECEEALAKAENTHDFLHIDESSFKKIKENSIDYATMEKIDCAAIVPSNMGWSDLGSWDSIWNEGNKDKEGNVLHGDIKTLNVKNSYIRTEENKLVTAIDLDNLIIVNTHDAVLIANKNRCEDVKVIVNQLKKEKRNEVTYHTKVYRPWGSFENMEEGERYKVKKLIVRPSRSLSLQYHMHRAEHWVIVSGSAEILRGDETHLLNENDSIYIPKKVKHRIKNIGETDLHIIEVQTGSILSEDDIIRLDDHYGRKN
jgi:mannose-1-phosphate guanylyltransferase/mannose-6-phosphate isomerase